MSFGVPPRWGTRDKQDDTGLGGFPYTPTSQLTNQPINHY